MHHSKAIKNKPNVFFEVAFSHGNHIGIVICKDISIPSPQETYITCREVTFPETDRGVVAIHIPKHLIMLIKEQPVEKPALNVVEFPANA